MATLLFLIWLFFVVILFWQQLLLGLFIFCVIMCIINIAKSISESRERYFNIKKRLWLLCRENGITDLKSDSEIKKFENIKKEFLPKYQNKLKLIYKITILFNKKSVIEFEKIYQNKLIKDKEKELKIKRELELKEIMRQEREAMLELEKKNQEKKKYLDTAMKIYKKCKSLEKIDDETFRVVSYSYGIDDVEVAKKMYKEIEKIEKDKMKKKKESELKKRKEKQDKEELSVIKNNLTIAKKKLKKRYDNRKVSDSLIDEISIDKINEYLNVSFVKYNITFTGRIIVSLKSTLEKEIKILNKKGILDGTFNIIVRDFNNNIVAEGYLNGEFLTKKYSVLCEFNNDYLLNKNEQYNVEIIPKYFWVLEK